MISTPNTYKAPVSSGGRFDVVAVLALVGIVLVIGALVLAAARHRPPTLQQDYQVSMTQLDLSLNISDRRTADAITDTNRLLDELSSSRFTDDRRRKEIDRALGVTVGHCAVCVRVLEDHRP